MHFVLFHFILLSAYYFSFSVIFQLHTLHSSFPSYKTICVCVCVWLKFLVAGCVFFFHLSKGFKVETETKKKKYNKCQLCNTFLHILYEEKFNNKQNCENKLERNLFFFSHFIARYADDSSHFLFIEIKNFIYTEFLFNLIHF